MTKFFGTDGIRGLSNSSPMDPETVMKVGMAAGAYFTKGKRRHRVIIGKDTRLSGYMIESALTSGFVAMGMDVFLVGPLPTPAVAQITRSMRGDVGVMISASHNPFYDNGIKLFQPNGLKLDDNAEKKIEKLIKSDLTKYLATPENLGRAKRIDDAPGRYIESVKKTFPKKLSLKNLKIVLDCANGAAYKIAPIIFWELGAEVISVHTSPNGFNINEKCGSTYPEILSSEVIKHQADIGISLDGDADRLIVCDETGKIIDGDQIMAAIATNWNERGKIKGGGIVSTIMSNMGLEKYLKSKGLNLERTKVGDRHVSERMRESGFNLGGEQSGHIIFNDFTTTGDGILASLQVLAAIVEQNDLASKVLNVFEPWPQVKENIRVQKSKTCPLEKENVKKEISKLEKKLKKDGRIIIRRSGTEPLIRIMVEGNDQDKIQKTSNSLSEIIKSNIS